MLRKTRWLRRAPNHFVLCIAEVRLRRPSYIKLRGAAVSGAAEARTERILLCLAGGIHPPNHPHHPPDKKTAVEAET